MASFATFQQDWKGSKTTRIDEEAIGHGYITPCMENG